MIQMSGTLLNCSDAVRDLLLELINNTRPTEPAISQEDRDRHAILYIVVVLLFYSVGIVIAIIMYLKREKNEAEEEKAFENYMNFRQDPEMLLRYHRVQAIVGQLNEVEERKKQRQQKQLKQQSKKSSIKSKHSQKSKLKFQLSWGSKETEIMDKAKSKKVSTGSSKSLEHSQARHLQPANPAVERSLSWAGRENKRAAEEIAYQLLRQDEKGKGAGTSKDPDTPQSCDTIGSPVIVVGSGVMTTPIVVVDPTSYPGSVQKL